MIAKIKEKLAVRKIRKLVSKQQDEVHFNDFIKTSVNFLFILPQSTKQFEGASEIIKYFRIHKKNCTVLVLETSYNLVSMDDIKVISYNKLDTTFSGLPGKEIMNLFEGKSFDVLINLDTVTDVFLFGLIAYINAKYKIGWEKDSCTTPYNFRIKTDEIKSDNYYRNLLNSLTMF